MSDKDLQATYRILDASANRAGEGLRTLEEFSRFVLNDAATTSRLKALRHDLTAAVNRLPRESLLRARDTDGDVGTRIGTPDGVLAKRPGGRRGGRCSTNATIAARVGRVRKDHRRGRFGGHRAGALSLLHLVRSTRVAAAHRRPAFSACTHLDSTCWWMREKVSKLFSETVTQLLQSGVDLLQLRDRSVDDRTLLSRAEAGDPHRSRAGQAVHHERSSRFGARGGHRWSSCRSR